MIGDEGNDGAASGGHDDAGGTPSFENLQERLAEHGRKLAEVAGGAPADAAATAAVAAEQLDMHEAAPLPWLESADDDDFDGGIDTRRVAIALGTALALLVAIVGGIWWATHRNAEGEQVADGSLIKAPAQPYKTAPANPGGKTYEGTGDSSYAVSQGQNPTAHLAAADGAAGEAAKPAEKPAEKPVAAPLKTPAPAAAGSAGGGVGVQVGAYTSQASAEAGWAKLEKQASVLSGVHHRVVQGQADIGTVYRLQAVTENDAAAATLCSALKAQGLSCQVRH